MASFDNIEKIFPESFFNIPHPDTPMINIQFRTGIGKDFLSNSEWSSITMHPSNHFDSITIDDEGGLQKIELNLYDKDFHTIEDLIVKTFVSTKLRNFNVQDSTGIEVSGGFFQKKFDSNDMINMRIRFGYYEKNEQNEDVLVQDDTVWQQRANSEKTFIRSPWIYLFITNFTFSVREDGLFATISAISLMNDLLTKTKLLKRFAVIRGKPIDIIKFFKKILEDHSNNTIEVITANEPFNAPLAVKNDDDSKDGFIEINLGSAADEKTVTWRTMKSILDEFCDKVPPLVLGSNDKQINRDDETEKIEEANKIINYRYRVELIENIYKLIFYYPDPTDSNTAQKKMRVYMWKETGNSMVKALDIRSTIDYANFSMPIFVKDTKTGNVALYTAGSEGDSTPNVGSIKEVTDALEDFDYAFVSENFYASGGGVETDEVAARVASAVVSRINQSIFQGSITIFGDPYYLFGGNVEPYKYIVRIVVMTPAYLDENNELIPSRKNYLTGYYYVTKISHKISSSGFETTLNLTRWPTR